MVEALNLGSISPEALRETFGHTFDDVCPVDSYVQPPKSFRYAQELKVRSAREVNRAILRSLTRSTELSTWQNRERARALSRLSEFFDSAPGSEPIRVYGNGETFRMSDWPRGTVIRYEMDSVEKDLEARNVSHFAIIAQAKTNVGGYTDCLVYAPATIGLSSVELLEGVPPNHYRQSAVLGEAMHQRFSGPGGAASERVFRYNLIEVWQIGAGVREQVGGRGFRPKKQR